MKKKSGTGEEYGTLEKKRGQVRHGVGKGPETPCPNTESITYKMPLLAARDKTSSIAARFT